MVDSVAFHHYYTLLWFDTSASTLTQTAPMFNNKINFSLNLHLRFSPSRHKWTKQMCNTSNIFSPSSPDETREVSGPLRPAAQGFHLRLWHQQDHPEVGDEQHHGCVKVEENQSGGGQRDTSGSHVYAPHPRLCHIITSDLSVSQSAGFSPPTSSLQLDIEPLASTRIASVNTHTGRSRAPSLSLQLSVLFLLSEPLLHSDWLNPPVMWCHWRAASTTVARLDAAQLLCSCALESQAPKLTWSPVWSQRLRDKEKQKDLTVNIK